MSSGSITVSYTTLAEIGLVAALIGGIAYAGAASSKGSPVPAAAHALDDAQGAAQSKTKKANKKKKGAVQQARDQAAPLVDQAVSAASTAVNTVKQQPAVQKAAQAVQDAAAQASTAAQGAAKAVQDAAAGAGAAAGSSASAPAPSSKKGKKKGNKGASPPSTSAGAGAPKPDAEAHAEQKHPAPSGPTADMRDGSDDEPVHVARVLKVVGGKAGADPNSLQVPGAKGNEAWERPDSFDDDDGEWEAVPSKSAFRSRLSFLIVGVHRS